MKGAPRCTYGKFWPSGASGCQLGSLGPKKLTIKMNKRILSLGMCFYYSNKSSGDYFMFCEHYLLTSQYNIYILFNSIIQQKLKYIFIVVFIWIVIIAFGYDVWLIS